MTERTQLFDKKLLLGGILGLAVGDALGVPFEFAERPILDAHPVTDMIGHRTYDLPEGTWSDDTSLTLCLIESLLEGLDYYDIAAKFVHWRRQGLWTATGKVFDIGNTTQIAIDRMIQGIDPVKCGLDDFNTNGNGSLMRVLPLAFYLHGADEENTRNVVFNISSLTHRHMISKLACWFYVKIAMNLISGKEKTDAIDKAFKQVSDWANDNNHNDDWDYLIRCNSNIKNVDRNDIKSFGYVINTFEVALWSFLRTNSYEEAVLTAVNFGRDTDTNAAVAGGLAGIYYKGNIREDWLEKLKRREDIVSLCDSFYSSIAGKIGSNP